MEKALATILYFLGEFGHTLDEFIERFEISKRSAYRTIEKMKNAGLVIENKNGYYRINTSEGYGKKLSDLLHFTEEENELLFHAIHSISNDNFLRDTLVKKLYSIYDFERVIEPVVDKERGKIVMAISQAIRKEKQVVLQHYKSSNSSMVRDRLVEPIRWADGHFNTFWCFEPESRSNKIFKTTRVKSVKKCDRKWQFAPLHAPGKMDAFRVSGDKEITVKLKMTLRACNLMQEEYPLTRDCISYISDNEYIYESKVRGFEGISRFILGLMDEIEVIENQHLNNYLHEKIMKKKF